MPRVFISHAGVDKKLIKPLVQALLLLKMELFVDNPADERWFFTAKETAKFEREGLLDTITYGMPYDDELYRGLGSSDVILLCISKNVSDERPIIVAEIATAARERWLVPVIVDNVDRGEIPTRVGLFRARDAQSLRIDTAAVLAAIQNRQAGRKLDTHQAQQMHQFEFVLKAIDDAKERWANQSNGVLPSKADIPVSPADLERETYRAGRMPQREDVDYAFDAARKSGVQAVALSGPENEYVDLFVDKIMLCRAVRKVRDAERCREITVRLPELKRSNTWDDFGREYGRAIADQLHISGNGQITHDDIARELAKNGLVVLCRTQPFIWQRLRERRKQVEFWLQYWSEVGVSPARPKVVTVLRTSLPRAEAGSPPDASAKAFIRWMKKLEAKTKRASGFLGFSVPQLAPLDVSELLAPIDRQQAREWANTVCPELLKRNKLDRAIDRIYDTDKASNNGLTMQEFQKKAPDAICDELSN